MKNISKLNSRKKVNVEVMVCTIELSGVELKAINDKHR